MQREENSQVGDPNTVPDPPLLANRIKSWRSQISNKRVYILAIFEKILVFGCFTTVGCQIGFFLDIFCNENNFNCSKDTKKTSMSVLNSITFLTSTLTYITYPFVFKINPKISIKISKLGLAFSILLFCFGPFWAMFVARTLMGFFAEFCHVVAHWMIYQIALKQHKELVFGCVYVIQGGVILIQTFLSYANNGGYWMWRIENAAPALLLIALVFFDLSVLINVNGLDFLQSRKTYEGVIEQLSTYYTKATSIEILNQFNQEKQTKTDSGLGGVDFDKISIWEQIWLYKRELFNSSLVTFLGVATFCDVFYFNGIYLGSHLLSNKEEVRVTKKAIFIAGVAYFAASVVLMAFKFIKKRKVLMIVSQLGSVLSLCVAAFGYFTNQLWIARLSIISGQISLGYIRITTFLYIVDVCVPSMISIPLLFMRLSSAVILFVFPLAINFENSSTKQVGWKLLGVAAFALVCVVVTACFMIETDGLSKGEISKKLRGLEQGGALNRLKERDVDGQIAQEKVERTGYQELQEAG